MKNKNKERNPDLLHRPSPKGRFFDRIKHMNQTRKIVISAAAAGALGGFIGASINHVIGSPSWMAGVLAAVITLILYTIFKYLIK